MNSAKNIPAQERRSRTLWEWSLELQWVGEVQTSDFCGTFEVCWAMPCCYSMPNLPLRLLGGASPQRGRRWTQPDQGGWQDRWREVIHTADNEGDCRSPGGCCHGKSSGRGTKEERGRVQSDHRRLLQQAPEKCLKREQWSHLPNIALKGFILVHSCVAVPEGGVLFMSLV